MTVDIQKSDGSVNTMGIDEFTRWMCLMEAFHFINKKAEELKVDVKTMLKPTAIDSYIKERFLSMKHDIQVEISHGSFE